MKHILSTLLVLIGFASFAQNPVFGSYIELDSGTTAQRPSPSVNGQIRYNYSTNKFEAYENGAWTNMITGAGTSLTYGLEDEIPFTNATTDDFDYSSSFTFDGSTMAVGSGSINTTGLGTFTSVSTGDFAGNGYAYFLGNSISNTSNTATFDFNTGSTGANGTNLVLYPGSHATTPFDIRFLQNTNTILQYDHSETTWDAQNNDFIANGVQLSEVASTIKGVKMATAEGNANDLRISGGASVFGNLSAGAYIDLYGASHVSFPDEIDYRASFHNFYTTNTGTGGGTIRLEIQDDGDFNFNNNQLINVFTIARSGGDISMAPNSSNHVNISSGGLEIAGTEVISSSRELSGVMGTLSNGGSNVTTVSGSTLRVNGGSNDGSDHILASFARSDELVGLTIRKGISGANGITIGTNTNHNLGIQTNNTVIATFSSSGNLTLTGTLGVTGTRVSNIYTTNQTTTNAETVDSDNRLKKQISTINYGLSDLLSLRPVQYKWKKSSDKSIHFGLIAQEVSDVIPEIVKERDNGFLGISYQELIPILINAIQEQQKEIDLLKSKVNE